MWKNYLSNLLQGDTVPMIYNTEWPSWSRHTPSPSFACSTSGFFISWTLSSSARVRAALRVCIASPWFDCYYHKLSFLSTCLRDAVSNSTFGMYSARNLVLSSTHWRPCFSSGVGMWTIALIWVSSAFWTGAVMICLVFSTVSTLNWILLLWNFRFDAFALPLKCAQCQQMQPKHLV